VPKPSRTSGIDSSSLFKGGNFIGKQRSGQNRPNACFIGKFPAKNWTFSTVSQDKYICIRLMRPIIHHVGRTNYFSTRLPKG
jgi:hypothetical protein